MLSRVTAGRRWIVFPLLCCLFIAAFSPWISTRLGEEGISVFFVPNAALSFFYFRAKHVWQLLSATLAFLIGGVFWVVAMENGVVAAGVLLGIDILEAALVAVVVRWIRRGKAGPRIPLRGLTYAVALLLVVGLTSGIAATLLPYFGQDAGVATMDWWTSWQRWFAGNMTAYLSVGAILLMAVGMRRTPARERLEQRPREFALAVGFLMVGIAIDLHSLPAVAAWLSSVQTAGRHPVLFFLSVPAVVWLCVRFHRAGAIVGIILTVIPAVHLSAAGFGPDWRGSVAHRVFVTQAFAMIMAVTAYVVAALSEQADRRRSMMLTAVQRGERRSRERSDFLMAISHEMRTPLNGIIGLAELMQQQFAGPLPSPYDRFAAIIHQSGCRLGWMIDRALDFNDLRQPDGSLAVEPIELNALLDELRSAVVERPDALAIPFTVTISETITLEASRAGLALAINNLLDNARSACAAGGSIALHAEKVGSDVVIRVLDTGQGLPDGFDRGDLRQLRRDDAPGMGLHLVDIIATMHHGGLEIDNRPGGGVEAVLRLPYRQPHPETWKSR